MTGRRLWEPPAFEWSQLGPIPVVLSDIVCGTDGELADGQADLPNRVIELDSSLSEQQLRVTAVHEWLHVVLYDAGFRTDAIEEQLVIALATAIVAREDFHANGGVAEQCVSSRDVERALGEHG